MFDSLLIANRGEIAVRVIKTARRMGLRTVAVFSDADAGAPHALLADEAHWIGPAPAADSYLRADRILDVARRTGAAALHPGYGFLSENAAFAEACAAAGVIFVGPPPAAIRAMGLKDGAKALMEKAGVPVVPGYHGANQDPKFLREKAYEIGYPVLIKAVAGGGGKGMRRVDKAREFEAALESARREAENAFGDPRVLVEKCVAWPRHVEVQVFADAHGNVVHLFERDCSLQRRHQKVIEEAPAPGMTPQLRAAIGAAAVEAARAVGYVGAGTVEFIADGSAGLKESGFFFMEMNTRLQVEHPVTEAITGLDLVELQLRVAAGESLSFGQDDLAIDGHAVEARVYAEDPERGFLPSTGRLHALVLPESAGVRVDCGVAAGGEASSYYDPMIAKVIAHAPTRDGAIDRLRDALAAATIAGPRTNLAFLRKLLDDPTFRAGRHDTGLIGRGLATLGAAPQPIDRGAVACAARRLLSAELRRLAGVAASRSDERSSPWATADGFQLGPPRTSLLPLLVDGEPFAVEVAWTTNGPIISGADDGVAAIEADGAVFALRGGRQTIVRRADPFDVMMAAAIGGDGRVAAPLNGRVLAVDVAVGQRVAQGDRIAVVEAMKMEHALTSPCDGVVAEVAVAVGDVVAERATIAVVGPAVAAVDTSSATPAS